jgi:hypothetical protein
MSSPLSASWTHHFWRRSNSSSSYDRCFRSSLTAVFGLSACLSRRAGSNVFDLVIAYLDQLSVNPVDDLLRLARQARALQCRCDPRTPLPNSRLIYLVMEIVDDECRSLARDHLMSFPAFAWAARSLDAESARPAPLLRRLHRSVNRTCCISSAVETISSHKLHAFANT